MRIPFLSKPAETKFRPIAPFVTPVYQYTPSDALRLIIHLPANGFVHLQPPLDPDAGIPGEHDHILKGELEIIAPAGWNDAVESITVGVRALSKLSPSKEREGEVDVLFERHVSIDHQRISPGPQR